MHERFCEEQYFRQPWLWALLLGGVVVGAAALAASLVNAGRDGTASSAVSLLSIVPPAVLAGLLALLLFWKMKLCTVVDGEGLSVRFFPFHWKPRRIPLEDAQRVEAVEYSPLRDYGGWGIRSGWAGRAYNVSGNRGVRLEFSSGKPLLIGSQRPEELARAIRAWMQEQKARRPRHGGPLGDCPR